MATEQPTHPGSRGADPVTDGTPTLEELNNLTTEVLRLYLTQANLVTTCTRHSSDPRSSHQGAS